MRKYLDLMLAGVVLLLAASVSTVAYLRLVNVEHHSGDSLSGVPIGMATFKAFQGGECFGSVTTDTKTAPADIFTARGKLRLQVHGQRVVATVFAGAFFNPFGQFVRGEIKLSTPQASLQIVAKNPNPIHLTVATTGPQGTSERVFEIPGPIISEHVGEEYLRLRYHLLEDNSRTVFSGLAQGIALGSLSQLNLRAERAATVADDCNVNDEAGPALQVDSLLSLLNSQRDRLRELVPGMLPNF